MRRGKALMPPYRASRICRAVQVLLGHASIATTERYTAVDTAEVRALLGASAEAPNADVVNTWIATVAIRARHDLGGAAQIR